MPTSTTQVLEFALLAATSIFFLVDPFTVIPLFLSMTADSPAKERRLMARRSAMTCAIVLATFALAGSVIFKMFGITLPAFKIAGGIILLQIGLDMLQARQSDHEIHAGGNRRRRVQSGRQHHSARNADARGARADFHRDGAGR